MVLCKKKKKNKTKKNQKKKKPISVYLTLTLRKRDAMVIGDGVKVHRSEKNRVFHYQSPMIEVME